MKTSQIFLIWCIGTIAVHGAPVDGKTSHGPLKLGESIATLSGPNLNLTEKTERQTTDGSKITIEKYKYDSSGMTFGDFPVSSARIEAIAGTIFEIDLILDSSYQSGPSETFRQRCEEHEKKMRLLSLALINKYGPVSNPSESPDSQTEFVWKGDDVILEYDFQSTPKYNEFGALVTFGSESIMKKAIEAAKVKQKADEEAEKEAAKKVQENL